MTDFVINEWLWHEARGEAGQAAQKRALEFLAALPDSGNKIIIIEGTAFDTKAWALSRSDDQVIRLIAKSYHLRVRQNSDCCAIFDQAAVPEFPVALENDVKDDDRYLIRAQLAVPNATIVTTDGPLIQALTKHTLPCLHRDQFFQTHFPAIF